MKEKKFNMNEYQNKYKKANYARMTLQLKPESAELLRKTAGSFGLSRSKLIVAMLDYITENNIDLSESEEIEI